MIFIFGSTGFLGAYLQREFKLHSLNVLTVGRNDQNDIVLDVFDYKSLVDLVVQYRPTIIINLIAATNVDMCEDDPSAAVDAHVKFPYLLSCITKFHKFKLIQISTDHVYDSLYSKETEINLVNSYAKSKYIGELTLINTNSLILRTNFYGLDLRSRRVGLVESILQRYKDRKKTVGFANTFFNALYVGDLAKILVKIIDTKISGTYNLGTTSHVSKADFVEMMFASFKFDLNLLQSGIMEIDRVKAARPNYMVSDVTKFMNDTGIALPNFQSSFNNFIRTETENISRRGKDEI